MCHAHYDCSCLNRNRIKIPWMQNFEMATVGYNYYTPSPSSKASHCGHSCCTFCFLVFVFPAFPCVLHFLAWEECVCDFGKSYLWLFFDKKLLTLGTLPSSLPSSESGTVHLLGQRGPWRLWLLPFVFLCLFHAFERNSKDNLVILLFQRTIINWLFLRKLLLLVQV